MTDYQGKVAISYQWNGIFHPNARLIITSYYNPWQLRKPHDYYPVMKNTTRQFTKQMQRTLIVFLTLIFDVCEPQPGLKPVPVKTRR